MSHLAPVHTLPFPCLTGIHHIGAIASIYLLLALMDQVQTVHHDCEQSLSNNFPLVSLVVV